MINEANTTMLYIETYILHVLVHVRMVYLYFSTVLSTFLTTIIESVRYLYLACVLVRVTCSPKVSLFTNLC